MDVETVLNELQALGTEQTKKLIKTTAHMSLCLELPQAR